MVREQSLSFAFPKTVFLQFKWGRLYVLEVIFLLLGYFAAWIVFLVLDVN